jgi:2-haloacid dehalogenase
MFVSANGWDLAGAAGVGLHTVWIDRTGTPPERLAAGPWQVRSLAEIKESVGS